MSTPPTPDLPGPGLPEDERPVDWTRTTGSLLLSYVPEDRREQAAGFLAVYRMDARAAAIREAAEAAAVWTGDDTPEEDRPGYDGATIDPEDRLRDAIDPEVGPSRREQLIAEYRDMVVGEIAGELRRLAATPTPTATTED